MSKKSEYITVLPPFSLNKEVDGISNERSSGDFQILKNYIPRDDILRVREGITVFPHTPASTVYNPTDDVDCVMWLRMETNATVRDCEINGIDYMDMDTGVVSADNSVYYEGSGSGFFNAYVGSTQLRKLTTALPTDFPACDDDEGYLIAFFLSLDWFPPEGEGLQVLSKEGVAGGSDILGQINVGVVRSAGWTYARPYFTAYDGFGASTRIELNYNMFTDCHCGIWVSKTLGLMGMRCRNAATGSNLANETFSCSQGTSTNRDASRRLKLGSNNSLGKFRGRIDDFLCYKNMIALDTEEKINQKIDTIFTRKILS